MIHCYMKNQKVYQFSSYQKAFELSEPPFVISIRKAESDSKSLIDFLKKYSPPQPEIVLSSNPISVPTIQFLINHFNIFRIVPYDIPNLQEMAAQAFQYHQKIRGHISTDSLLEKQLMESAKMAELGMIGSGIAHELSNPLGGLISFIKLIKMDSSQEDTHYTDILKMEKTGQKCKEVVEDLLKFSRPYHLCPPSSIDLRKITKQSIQLIKLQAKNLKWEVNFPNKPLEIKGQANLLVQSIYNILQNEIDAIDSKATREGSIYNGLIKIKLFESKDKFIILIKDNGADIPKSIEAKILNPLFSTKKPMSHTDLSLIIANQIIAEHEGNLDIDSHPKTGTTVKISFKRPDLTSL